MKNETDIPETNWTLDQLGAFCISRHQRMAADAWAVGRAMCIAKERCVTESQPFTAWKRTHGFTHAMASRYMRLYRAFSSSGDRERLSRIGIMAAMIEAGIVKPRDCQDKEVEIPDEDEEPLMSQEGSLVETDGAIADSEAPTAREPAEKATPAATPAWAVTDDEEEEGGDEEALPTRDDLLAEVYSRRHTLEEECRKAVPWQVRLLKEKAEMLLGQPVEELHHAWPSDLAERRQIAEDIDGVIRLLPALAATLEAERTVLAIAG